MGTRISFIVVALIFPAIGLAGMYKCKQPDGSVVYQQARCSAQAEGGSLDVRPQSFGEGRGAESITKRIQRGTDALRDLRAKKLGISRDRLDNYEGREAEGSGHLQIVEHTGYHNVGYYIVEGTVRNGGDGPVRYAQIKGRGLDAAGDLVSYADFWCMGGTR